MAKVWPFYEGKRPTTADVPWADMPLDDAIRVLDLEPEHFLRDLSRTPKFGDTTRNLTLLGYRHVVVEVGDDEAKADWKPGFYRSPLPPVDAFFRVQVHQSLGDRWRDEWKKGQDADGDPAMWLWAVLKADAPDSEWAWDNRERIQADVRKAATESGISDWVFVRFRNDKEERAAS
jgi:hypothetical protein